MKGNDATSYENNCQSHFLVKLSFPHPPKICPYLPQFTTVLLNFYLLFIYLLLLVGSKSQLDTVLHLRHIEHVFKKNKQIEQVLSKQVSSILADTFEVAIRCDQQVHTFIFASFLSVPHISVNTASSHCLPITQLCYMEVSHA